MIISNHNKTGMMKRSSFTIISWNFRWKTPRDNSAKWTFIQAIFVWKTLIKETSKFCEYRSWDILLSFSFCVLNMHSPHSQLILPLNNVNPSLYWILNISLLILVLKLLLTLQYVAWDHYLLFSFMSSFRTSPQ